MDNKALVDQLIVNGRKALAELESYTQEQIDELCRLCCEAFAEHAEEMVKEAVEETGLGNVPDKIIKNTGSPDGAWYAIKGKKSIGVIGRDEKHHLTLVAHPKGHYLLRHSDGQPEHHDSVQRRLCPQGPQCYYLRTASPGKEVHGPYLQDFPGSPAESWRSRKYLPVCRRAEHRADPNDYVRF